jgi:hypothetical protein
MIKINFKKDTFKFLFKFLMVRTKLLIYKLYLFIAQDVKQKIILMTKGESSWYPMIYGYGLFPALFVYFFCQKTIEQNRNNFFIIFIELLLFLYFAWHIYVIYKTLKVQPQYVAPKKLTKKELYAGKTKDEIKAIKKEQKKEVVQKLMLQRAWDTTPYYKIIGAVELYICFIELQLFLEACNLLH